MSVTFVQFEKAMIVTLDELVAAGHGDQQYQELFAELYVSISRFSFHLIYRSSCASHMHLTQTDNRAST